MSDSVYAKQLGLAQERGLFIDPRVERKEVNGVFGFFAKDDIPKDTRLVAYPIKSCMQNLDDSCYQEELPKTIKSIHKAVLEYVKGQESEYYCHFMQFDPLEILKKTSTFYFDQNDFDFLRAMNPMLLDAVFEVNRITQSRIDDIKKLEPGIDEETIALVCLNYASRAWSDSNFLPIIDYANHSDRKGRCRSASEEEYLIVSKVNYKKGDQIYLSYSRKDMYFHCINYNYFDPGAAHSIHYGDRFTQVACSEREKEIFKHTASLFAVNAGQDTDNNIHYRCIDSDVCFLETAPTVKLIQYIESNYFPSEQEWQQKRCNLVSLHTRLITVLNFMLKENKIDQFKLKDVPTKLHRFFHLLKKEKKMLQQNLDWVMDSMYL